MERAPRWCWDTAAACPSPLRENTLWDTARKCPLMTQSGQPTPVQMPDGCAAIGSGCKLGRIDDALSVHRCLAHGHGSSHPSYLRVRGSLCS